MKKPICPFCKKRKLKEFSTGRFTRTCGKPACFKAMRQIHSETYWKKKNAKFKPVKRKCTYCGETFKVLKPYKRYLTKTCGQPACLAANRRVIVKAWKKRNPDLLREQKKRWKARVRKRIKEAKKTG